MKLPRLHLIDAKLRDLATVLRMKPELEEIEAHDSRVDGASWMLSPKRNIEELRQQISSIMDVESIYIEEVKDISLNPAAEKIRLSRNRRAGASRTRWRHCRLLLTR